MSRIVTVREAVELVKDGSTLVVGGSGAGHAVPQRFIDELRALSASTPLIADVRPSGAGLLEELQDDRRSLVTVLESHELPTDNVYPPVVVEARKYRGLFVGPASDAPPAWMVGVDIGQVGMDDQVVWQQQAALNAERGEAPPQMPTIELWNPGMDPEERLRKGAACFADINHVPAPGRTSPYTTAPNRNIAGTIAIAAI